MGGNVTRSHERSQFCAYKFSWFAIICWIKIASILYFMDVHWIFTLNFTGSTASAKTTKINTLECSFGYSISILTLRRINTKQQDIQSPSHVAERYIDLLCQFRPEAVYRFLRSNDNYRLEEALDVSKFAYSCTLCVILYSSVCRSVHQPMSLTQPLTYWREQEMSREHSNSFYRWPFNASVQFTHQAYTVLQTFTKALETFCDQFSQSQGEQ